MDGASASWMSRGATDLAAAGEYCKTEFHCTVVEAISHPSPALRGGYGGKSDGPSTKTGRQERASGRGGHLRPRLQDRAHSRRAARCPFARGGREGSEWPVG